MRLTRVRRSAAASRSLRAFAAGATALAVGLSIGGTAAAAPSPAQAPAGVDQHALESLGAFAPAIIGSAATPGADGKVNAGLLRQARTMSATPGLPPAVAAMWNKVIDFLGAPGERQVSEMLRSEAAKKKNDLEIPNGPNKPRIQEFLYPTFGFGCMPGNGTPTGGNSMGRALVTAGKQESPWPGPRVGQAGYVYTSLGTGPAVNNPSRPLWVSWINIDNGRTGQMQLKRNPKINVKDGPGTFTGIASTGRGRVLSTIYGDVTTKTDKRVFACSIVPTIGIAIV